MELAYDLASGSAAAYTLIGAVNDVTNGSNASIAWNGLSNSTEYEWYATVSDGKETVTGSTWRFTTGDSSTNHSPVITEGASTGVTMSEDSSPDPFSLTLHATDVDVDDTLTWSISGAASHGTATATGTGASKAIEYTPTANYSGPDSFVVQVADGNGGADTIIVNVTITAINDAPVCSPTTLTTAEDTAGDAAPVCTDADTGDILTYSIVGAASKGTASVVAGSLHYVPNLNTNGADSFTYRANDTHEDSNTATVTVAVTAVNDAPAAPILVQPADHATGVATLADLGSHRIDPDSATMDVSFYGRPKTGGARDFTLIVLPDSQKYAYPAPTMPPSMPRRNGSLTRSQRGTSCLRPMSETLWKTILRPDGSSWTPPSILWTPQVFPTASALETMTLLAVTLLLSETYFGVARFDGKSWYGGHYGSNNRNNYSLFSASGMDFILINLDIDPSTEVLNLGGWAADDVQQPAGHR